MSPHADAAVEQDPNNHALYPHSTDFEGRPPPPPGGYSWAAIQKAIKHGSLHELRRTDKGQYEYEVWQNSIDRAKHGNIGAYIALELLGWKDLIDPADKIFISSQESSNGTPDSEEQQQQQLAALRASNEPVMTLRVNHYPFPVEGSIQYFVLWATRDMSVPEERDRLNRFLERQFVGTAETHGRPASEEMLAAAPGKKKEWMWFVNPIELRSVATVHHLHIFVRDIDL
ncbi:hypothetical protein DFQ26_001323 [Actinomortierella ambigua]|nr:hypothetical protein DFQ26_001323 [Actinomortierella ambigua]